METVPSKQHIALAGKIVANILCLPHEVVTYYLSHPEQIPAALVRGFVIPEALKKSAVSVSAPVILDACKFPSPKAGLTEIGHWIQFWLMFKIDFSKQLANIIPEKGRMYVVNPGTMLDEELIMLLEPLVSYSVELDFSSFTKAVVTRKMTLRSFADSVEPDTEYLGKSAVDADRIGLTWMTRAEYIIRQAFNSWRKAPMLDDRGYTIFPLQRSGNNVAVGGLKATRPTLDFGEQYADYRSPDSGPRLAVDVPLRT